MKVWVLTVEDMDIRDTYVFASREKALETVRHDIADHLRFDTDEPHCSRDELEAIQDAAVDELAETGAYDGTVSYALEEKEVIE